MSKLERIYFFHQQVLSDNYPNASSIIDEFEVSKATAHRDIEYMKERLLAPLKFHHGKNGYYYETQFSLPFENSPQIIFLLTMVHRLAEESGLSALPEVERLKKRLGELLSADYKRIIDNLRCERIEVQNIQPEILKTIIEAFHLRRRMEIIYSKPDGSISKRIIEPLRFINYQGRWYVLGFCHLRQEPRTFLVARIRGASVLKTKSRPENEIGLDPDKLLDSAFGIFKGEKTRQVKILFTGKAANIIREQKWHKDQQLEPAKQGVILTLPVADFTEIKMKVLQFGANARVLEPRSLKQDMAEEIARMYEGSRIKG
ncbi:WYL domain-containing protein [Desulfohalobiaceae bacterium Ax17]|uniref:helix-turn-helix transcriptional regulator n=1 Tax=Desulfovulcanus ferrireducens TaxID=2831190 RepID=UPI00207BC367|nr:WYL domain-containing protein [Desulfovulcanus ferrireducens]MBT8764421.1 WYL domain-containing protein [Desulfovulcanus ferrireducens]